MEPLSIIEKIWHAHTVVESPHGGETLLYMDRHFLTEVSFLGFDLLKTAGHSIRRPELVYICADHVVPTTRRALGPTVAGASEALAMLDQHLEGSGIQYIRMNDPRQGIVHVTMPELGISLPGFIICGDDSHTTTHGGLGAIGFGIGYTDASHVLATQTLWQVNYKTMRINLVGDLPSCVTAKDLSLAIIGQIGAGAGVGHIIEFHGPCISNMSVEQRMTLCNMSVEAGARAGLVAPDETTFAYIKGRPYAPTGEEWDHAVAYWSSLASDPGAKFDRVIDIRVDGLSPTVTWGTSPEDIAAIDGVVPNPEDEENLVKRARMTSALEYMGLTPGTAISDIAIDRVFIGSCSNSRIEDLRLAADIARRGVAVVPAMVVPGSTSVKRQAEEEGLDRIFLDAGFEWHDAGCSLCCGMNGDMVAAGERCAATINRNFVGRQGPGSRTHLMNPALAAAAALTGRITDPRLIP